MLDGVQVAGVQRTPSCVGWGVERSRISLEHPPEVPIARFGDRKRFSPEGIFVPPAPPSALSLNRLSWMGEGTRIRVDTDERKETASVLMIRLSRRGARKQPYYRIVVIEKDRARDGRSVEVVGTYNPRTNPASVELKRERIDYWTSKGAQLSDRVRKLVEKGASAPPAPTPETPTPTAAA